MDTNLNLFEPLPLAARGLGTHTSAPQVLDEKYRGLCVFLNITAVSGTSPTLEVKLQAYNPAANSWDDITGAVFATKTAAGQDMLCVYPGIAEVANKKVSTRVTPIWRVSATVNGTSPSFTFRVMAYGVM